MLNPYPPKNGRIFFVPSATALPFLSRLPEAVREEVDAAPKVPKRKDRAQGPRAGAVDDVRAIWTTGWGPPQ